MCMRKSRKIKAFTLTEVMITMAVSAVVVALAYMTFNTIGNYFRLVQDQNNRYNEWLSARLFLSRDITKADSLHFAESSLLVYGNDTLTAWTAVGDTLLRNDGVVKNFGLQAFGLQAYTDPETGLVNQVVLSQYRENDDSLYFRFYKTYPIAFQINK